MPSFGRIGKHSNRSQHNLADQTSAAVAASSASAGTPPSASSTALNSSESFDIRSTQQQQQQRQQSLQQNQPPPPPQQQQQQQQQQQSKPQNYQGQPESNQPFQQHAPNHSIGGALPANIAGQAAFDSRQQKHQDFADHVSRSQSTRYPQVTPLQTQQYYGIASSSVDDLSHTLPNHSSPIVGPGQQPALPHHQAAPPETKPSKRRLIRNILSGSSSTRTAESQQQYDNTTGLARRPSKRISNPPTIRTGVSHASLEQQQQQQPGDWQQGPHQQPSPLQANTQDPRQPTIRHIPHDIDTASYNQKAAVYQQQPADAHLQAQRQSQTEPQQPYGHIVIDPVQEQQFQFAQAQGQYPPDNTPPVYVGHLGASPQQPNPETVSQLSHESPVTDPDQRSPHVQSAQASPAVNYPHPDFLPNANQNPQALTASQSQPQQQPMAPPPGGSQGSRRTQEAEKAMRSQAEPPPGPASSYRHNQANNMSAPPPGQGQGSARDNYRSSTVQDRSYDGSGGEQGRSSPQPSSEQGQDPEKQFKELLTKYKNVKRLYFDGKTQIEQLVGQVEQLQNAVANQRMSQSRTALDDSEYVTRFTRLNGAINNLSFNIRKDWQTIPPWLEGYVNPDAIKTGKQEMTAVGRAVISRWLMDEIFNKCFHPGLDVGLSRHLKEIEQNIRKFSYTMSSQEEFEALTAKVLNWRMATLEGLKPMLQSPESADHRGDFTQMSTSNLTASLYEHLVDPPPAGVDGSASMIVELAVGIAANLPLESRDVAIVYPEPGDIFKSDVMELEKVALPPLADQDAEDSGKDEDKLSKRGEKTKSGMLTMLGGAPHPTAAGSRKGSLASTPGNTDASETSALPLPKDPGRVRFAAFPSVEVRGRQVLFKAPCWSLV